MFHQVSKIDFQKLSHFEAISLETQIFKWSRIEFSIHNIWIFYVLELVWAEGSLIHVKIRRGRVGPCTGCSYTGEAFLKIA
jgi:hypothetical protein